MKINVLETPTFWLTTTDKKDRNEAGDEMINRLGFTNVVKHMSERVEDGRVGCTIAHMNAHEEAKNNLPALFLEDDCLDTQWFNPTIECPDDADAIYLGHSHWAVQGFQSKGGAAEWSSVEGYPEVIKVHNMLATHAILIISDEYRLDCKKYFEINIEEPWWHDVSLASRMKYWNIYATTHPFFYQSDQTQATERSITNWLGDGEAWHAVDKHFFEHNQEVWCGAGGKTVADVMWEESIVEECDHSMARAWKQGENLRGYRNGQKKGEGCNE